MHPKLRDHMGPKEGVGLGTLRESVVMDPPYMGRP